MSKQYYWKNICEMQEKQTQKGIDTYGQTLEENTALTMEQRITMLEEELVDSLMYLEHIKAKFLDYKNDFTEDLLNMGYTKGRNDREKEITGLIEFFVKDWNNQSSKKIPYKAVRELTEFIRQNHTQESVSRWIKEKK